MASPQLYVLLSSSKTCPVLHSGDINNITFLNYLHSTVCYILIILETHGQAMYISGILVYNRTINMKGVYMALKKWGIRKEQKCKSQNMTRNSLVTR